jgi:ABC-2 type transport system permease protein
MRSERAGRALAIARQDWRILRRAPSPMVLLILAPLLLIPFVKPAFRLAFLIEHRHHVAGAEQAVPAMGVTFAFFLVANCSMAFFREHAWATWDRLRASPASPAEIVAGKVALPLLLGLAQFMLVFVLGGSALGLTVRGSWAEMIAVGLPYSVCLVAIGVVLTALCRTFMQVTALTNFGALLFAGLGGALVPLAFLPRWAQSLGPIVPSYWAMRGYRDAILGHSGALVSAAVLSVFAAVLVLLAVLRFRCEESKIAWT